MRAELKEIRLSGEAVDIKNYQPKDPLCFSLFIRLMIGPEGENVSESFDITLCTPEWIKQCANRSSFISGLHMLIVPEYDYDSLVSYLNSYCKKFEESEWDDIAAKLSFFGHWEFDGESYQVKMIDFEQ